MLSRKKVHGFINLLKTTHDRQSHTPDSRFILIQPNLVNSLTLKINEGFYATPKRENNRL